MTTWGSTIVRCLLSHLKVKHVSSNLKKIFCDHRKIEGIIDISNILIVFKLFELVQFCEKRYVFENSF